MDNLDDINSTSIDLGPEKATDITTDDQAMDTMLEESTHSLDVDDQDTAEADAATDQDELDVDATTKSQEETPTSIVDTSLGEAPSYTDELATTTDIDTTEEDLALESSEAPEEDEPVIEDEEEEEEEGPTEGDDTDEDVTEEMDPELLDLNESTSTLTNDSDLAEASLAETGDEVDSGETESNEEVETWDTPTDGEEDVKVDDGTIQYEEGNQTTEEVDEGAWATMDTDEGYSPDDSVTDEDIIADEVDEQEAASDLPLDHSKTNQDTDLGDSLDSIDSSLLGDDQSGSLGESVPVNELDNLGTDDLLEKITDEPTYLPEAPAPQTGSYDGTLPSSVSTVSEEDALDVSQWLVFAIVVLICFRVPAIKRFLEKPFKKRENSSSLPYHVNNKELD
ncbi:hypothetical protein DM01DRAFT_1404187 [Hesseltinella vesiculosa]|uniref:Uncharacterized protein n=1 Tax=Hesseltinella vesiculosa TaxID=101127 RepID=A0A1X2GTK8_9FUNG|nr:hypothetical protein DM01DRAFT_1404187 [Hesseltinella vesiculosa]